MTGARVCDHKWNFCVPVEWNDLLQGQTQEVLRLFWRLRIVRSVPLLDVFEMNPGVWLVGAGKKPLVRELKNT